MLSQTPTNASNDSSFESSDDNDISDYIELCSEKDFDLKDLDKLSKNLHSKSRLKQHYGAIGIRKIITQIEAIQRVIDANVIPRLVEFLQMDNERHLQNEAARVLSNICSGNTQQVQKVVENDAVIPTTVRLLASPEKTIVENAIYLLGNIAAEGSEFKGHLIANGVLPAFIAALKKAIKEKSDGILSGCVWALSGMSEEDPPADANIKDALVILCDVVQKSKGLEVIDHALHAISHFSRSPQIQITEDFSSKFLSTLVQYLSCSRSSIVLSALKILGYALSKDDNDADIVLKTPNLIKALFDVLKSKEERERKSVCWVMSNITAGRSDQLELIIGKFCYVKKLLKVIESDTLPVRKEASRVILNAGVNANQSQMMSLTKMGALFCMFKLTQQEDEELVEIGIEGIEAYTECLGEVLEDARKKNDKFKVLENSDVFDV